MEPTTIKKVYVEAVNIALDEPFIIAIGIQNNIENVIVSVELESGIKGYGEAAPFGPINGENQATVLAMLNSCKDFLIGKDVSAYKTISKSLRSAFWAQVTARCAVEMALIDALTRSLNIPLFKYLGGAVTKIETDYTVDIVPPDTAKVNASKLAQKGYRTLKTKVGKNLAGDIDRILAIKDGAPECEITLDANQGFSPSEAVHFMEELQKNNIRPVLFEQPVLKSDLRGMKYVKDHISVPVAADESVFTVSDALNVIHAGCADIINIKIMKSGIVEALDIAAIASSANLKLMIGCMLESRLALGCSVHIAAGLGTFDFIDLDPHIDQRKEPFTGGPDFSAPFYSLSDIQKGLGFQKR